MVRRRRFRFHGQKRHNGTILEAWLMGFKSEEEDRFHEVKREEKTEFELELKLRRTSICWSREY